MPSLLIFQWPSNHNLHNLTYRVVVGTLEMLHDIAVYTYTIYSYIYTLSVTLVHCVHTVRHTIMVSSPYSSPIILVSGDITFIPKFEGGHPERGH